MAVQTIPIAVTAANTQQTRNASFTNLMARFRRQNSDLDSAEDQDDIDRLASDSQNTLFDLTATRVDDANALGDKIDALITRYEDFGTLPMDHVRQLLLDIRGLANEPVSAWGRAFASYQRRVDAVACILDREDYAEEELTDAQRARNNATEEMFATPVPNISALAIKLDVLAADLRDFEPDEASIAYVVADAHRLAQREGGFMHADASESAITAATATPAKAFTDPTDIERHWQELCAAHREFEADPDVPDDDVRTAYYWHRIETAEIAILDSADTSMRAAELRLWVAWSHANPSNVAGRVNDFVVQADVAALRHIRSGLDWHEKLIFAAILNLRGER